MRFQTWVEAGRKDDNACRCEKSLREKFGHAGKNAGDNLSKRPARAGNLHATPSIAA